MDVKCRSYGKLCAEALDRCVYELLNLNGRCDFRITPSIEPYVAAKCKRLCTDYNMKPDYLGVEPTYVTLDRPKAGGCFTRRSPTMSLKELLYDFSVVYRMFEISLIGNALNLQDLTKDEIPALLKPPKVA